MRLSLLLTLSFALLCSHSLPSAFAGLPNGAFETPIDPDCSPEIAFQNLNPAARSMKSMAAAVQDRIDRCQPSWYQAEQNSIINLAQFAILKYPMNQPFLKRIKIPLTDGRIVRGLLALKPGNKARDLIIVRCGIFCDAGAGAINSSHALMNLFEENPVNVLILNSSSGADWAKDNGIAHIGGFDEGFQNLEVAKYAMENQAALKLKIRNIHVMGISLGGLSSLFSSFYHEATPDFRALPMKSFVAICPMVDAKAQFTEVVGAQVLPKFFFGLRLSKLYAAILPFVEPLHQKSIMGGKIRGDVGLALDLSANFYEENWNRLGFARYINKQGRLNRDTLLDATSITHYVNRFSPSTLVLHASDDMMVPWEQNSKKLLKLQDENLGVLRVDRGNHCAFGPGMGWPAFSTLLSRAFQTQKDLVRRVRPLPPSFSAFLARDRLWDTVTRSHYQWSVDTRRAVAKLKVFTFSAHAEGCGDFRPTRGPVGHPYQCQQTRNVEIPLNELSALGINTAVSDAWSASRLERYLNVHTRIKTASGALSAGSKEEPAYLETNGNFHPTYGVL